MYCNVLNLQHLSYTYWVLYCREFVVFTHCDFKEMWDMYLCVQVYTKEASVLIASIVCVSCRDINQFTVTNSQVIKLVGGCVDCPWQDTVYRWSITRKDGVPLPISLATTTTGGDRRNLVVRSSVIEPGYAYRSDRRRFTF